LIWNPAPRVSAATSGRARSRTPRLPVRRDSGDPAGQRRHLRSRAEQRARSRPPALPARRDSDDRKLRPDCCPPSHASRSAPPEKLRLGSAVLPPRRPELHRRFGYRGNSEIPPRRPAPQAAPDCCPPSHASRSAPPGEAPAQLRNRSRPQPLL